MPWHAAREMDMYCGINMYCEKGKSMRFHNRTLRRVPAMLVAAAWMAVAGVSHADSGQVTVDVAAGKKIFLNGKDDVSPCQSCHGPKALGIDDQQTPRLAGVGYAYIDRHLSRIGVG